MKRGALLEYATYLKSTILFSKHPFSLKGCKFGSCKVKGPKNRVLTGKESMESTGVQIYLIKYSLKSTIDGNTPYQINPGNREIILTC